MSQIQGTYTIRIADKAPNAASEGGTVLTVQVLTKDGDSADTVAGVIGRELDRLGLTIAGPQGD